MTITRAYLIRLGEKVLTTKQVKLAKALAASDPESEEHYELMQQADAFDPTTALNILVLAGNYRDERDETETTT